VNFQTIEELHDMGINWASVGTGQNPQAVQTYLTEIMNITALTGNAILSSVELEDPQQPQRGINSRVVTPKPIGNITNSTANWHVYIDSNSLSRKNTEIKASPRVNLLYYDAAGVGYVSMRGNATLCSKQEATEEYWSGWDFFYPNGSSCPFYSLLRFEPDHIEYVSVSRYNVQSGRDDWLPVTLEIANGAWELTVAPAPVVPTPPPPPSPPTPAPAEKWVCTVCQHVYDPAADGGGKAFEDLPDTWLCPVCGQPKSAYRKQSGGMWVERI
jgi:rubredoxin/general stress protein 26